uniref:Uncharacterized protein n=1 Tax=Chaetoceros debilis TaxID=122233 RepID=A0A7S3PY00_9STRA|mmetsp:Transcript_29544/g.45098  ORF Transcript_29544/g.45098 Transcript_29544/m.45098 type:complete len:386 (+) Transcript_29544:116-1273(+)
MLHMIKSRVVALGGALTFVIGYAIVNQVVILHSFTADNAVGLSSITSAISSSSAEESSKYYSWIGNHWIPPIGVSTYTPSDFLTYFRSRNTLFVGDSTNRRFYNTIFALMNATDFANIQLESLDHWTINDRGKWHHPLEGNCSLPDRYDPIKIPIPSLCRDVPIEISENITITPQESSSLVVDHRTKKGRIDYLHLDCLRDIRELLLPEHVGNLSKYDLIVIGAGIHEVVRPGDCAPMHSKKENITQTEALLQTLKNSTSSKLQVVYRTTGFKADGIDVSDWLWRTNQEARDFFRELNEKSESESKHKISSTSDDKHDDGDISESNSNITLVDWAAVIDKRSFGKDRINGDSKVHYGLEARLLYGQQLLHQLLLARDKGLNRDMV